MAIGQTGMSAGRNSMERKSRRCDVPERLEPSLSDGASAEEEGLDRFKSFASFYKNLVNYTVFKCILGTHPVIPVHIHEYLLFIYAGMY